VLVVEDDPDNRELLAASLEDFGALVTAAGSAQEALAAFDREIPDVLVSDLGLPGEDGFELLRQIRSRPASRGAGVPAIALSGYADPPEHAADCFQGFLIKPAHVDDLAALIQKVLGRQP
jgi:CheY-like chemotaxis protein